MTTRPPAAFPSCYTFCLRGALRPRGAEVNLPPIRFNDLLHLDRRALRTILSRAHPLDPDALAGKQYQGVDLSLPVWMTRILWKTFRKTFYRDPHTGELRGWNVRMEQTGIDGERTAKLRDAVPWTFGHYRVRSAAGVVFPGGWRGSHYLDYRQMGNPLIESLPCTPLVAVNEGDMSLLLGWEVIMVGPASLPLPDYWALRLEGPIEHLAEPPRR